METELFRPLCRINVSVTIEAPFKHPVLSNKPHLPRHYCSALADFTAEEAPARISQNQFYSELLTLERGLKCLPRRGLHMPMVVPRAPLSRTFLSTDSNGLRTVVTRVLVSDKSTQEFIILGNEINIACFPMEEQKHFFFNE